MLLEVDEEKGDELLAVYRMIGKLGEEERRQDATGGRLEGGRLLWDEIRLGFGNLKTTTSVRIVGRSHR